MEILKKIAFYIFMLFVLPNCIGQSDLCQKTDIELTADYSKISPFYYADNDSLVKQSEHFSNKLLNYITKNSQSLNCQFQSFKDSIGTVLTTENGVLRIYSWDTWQGGTMKDYANIFQYKSGNKVLVDTFEKVEGYFGTYYSDLKTLKINDKSYYLAISSGSLSSKDCYEKITVFSIEKNKLGETPIIKTKNGLKNSISFEYDFFSVVDRPERPIQLIKYDQTKKTIYIPVVFENGKVTDKYITYKFTGEYFEKIAKK
jgi:hypothetical protein